MTLRFEVQEDLEAISFIFNGQRISALPGDTIASALYASGIHAFWRSRQGEARGMLCGIGVCFGCLVEVDGKPDQRACQVRVTPGMVVTTNLKGQR